MALGTIFSPLFIGQIADRYFSSEKLMGAALHSCGGRLSIALRDGRSVDRQFNDHFSSVSLRLRLFYSPTFVLSNSITFAHVPDGGRDFPRVRVFGTIGWIVAGLIVGQVLARSRSPDARPTRHAHSSWRQDFRWRWACSAFACRTRRRPASPATRFRRCGPLGCCAHHRLPCSSACRS